MLSSQNERGDSQSGAAPKLRIERVFSLEGQRVSIRSKGIGESTRLTMLADTHLALTDEREAPFRQYSARMAAAYQAEHHLLSKQPTTSMDCFVEGLAAAREHRADLLILAGDILSFPSEANVEWVRKQLLASGLPWLYITGNHDWHYEGLEGSERSLRETWIERRLLPLYGGADPMISSVDIRGLRIIVLDNSIHEILPSQLSRFQTLLSEGLPTLLFVHIPLYVPGKTPSGFGCGHPDWGAHSDRAYEIERRQPWPEHGHSDTTFAFHRAVFSAPNLLGVFAGHTHRPGIDILNGTPQVVTAHNAVGGRLDIEVSPLPQNR